MKKHCLKYIRLLIKAVFSAYEYFNQIVLENNTVKAR